MLVCLLRLSKQLRLCTEPCLIAASSTAPMAGRAKPGDVPPFVAKLCTFSLCGARTVVMPSVAGVVPCPCRGVTLWCGVHTKSIRAEARAPMRMGGCVHT